MSLEAIARKIRDAFTYDPGHSDLDNEQPIAIHITLGDYRRLDYELRTLPEIRRDADRWASLQFLHPADIAVVIMGAKDGTELVEKLSERADAWIAKARAGYSPQSLQDSQPKEK